MCDSPPCIDMYITILNIDIPDFLKDSTNYVVKGGRAYDFYTFKEKGQKMLHLTDWDLACNSENCENLKENLIIFLQNRHPDLIINVDKLKFLDDKEGFKLTFKCNENNCDFIDLVKYNSTDSIFTDTLTDNGINYINHAYMIKDLTETYNDRLRHIINGLENYNITFNEDSFTNFVQDYNTIKKIIIKQIHDKYDINRSEIIASYEKKLKKPGANIIKLNKELDDLLDEIRKQYDDNYQTTISQDLPPFRDILSKFYRTKERYNILKTGGKRKRKTLKNRKYKRKTKRTRNYLE
jgi:hypothetical protein